MRVEISPCVPSYSNSLNSSTSFSPHQYQVSVPSSMNSSDLLFETHEALIRISGPVKGFANHLTTPEQPSISSRPASYCSNSQISGFSYQRKVLKNDGSSVSEYGPEGMSFMSDNSSVPNGEQTGVLRRLSTSISEFASALVSTSSPNDNNLSKQTGDVSSSTEKGAKLLNNKASCGASSNRNVNRKTRKQAIAFRLGESNEDGSDGEYDEDDDCFQNAALSGHHNPFLSEINFLDNFYQDFPDSPKSNDVNISTHNYLSSTSSQTPLKSYSASGFIKDHKMTRTTANSGGRVIHSSMSYTSFDINHNPEAAVKPNIHKPTSLGTPNSSDESSSLSDQFAADHRRRSLDVGFTDEFFAAPKSTASSNSSNGAMLDKNEVRKHQLMSAIEQCKRMLKQNQNDEALKEKFGHHLVKLRYLLLEESDSSEDHIKKINGHKMIPSMTKATSKSVCEHCKQLLIGLVHSWFECLNCGFRSHDKCMDAIIRVCPSVKIEQSQASYNWTICKTNGLASQEFRCAECKKLIGIGSVSIINPVSVAAVAASNSNLPSLNTRDISTVAEEALMCDYSGLYFCSDCHWNDTIVIPARVLLNWDFKQCKVSRYWRSYLLMMYHKAIINISQINSTLYNHIEELSLVNQLRVDILKMKVYFIGCRNASKNRLLLLLKSRQHFVENSHMYSLRDLVDIENKTLVNVLKRIHTVFANHIRIECELCRNKGFICEICNSSQIIFPFDVNVHVCDQCQSTFHENCFDSTDLQECPRCSRRRRRMSTQSSTITES